MLGIWTELSETISIVSHWMESGDAHTNVQHIQNDPRPLHDLVQLKDIASGLHYLRTQELGPICHSDLTGANVLISNYGHALLTDFGYSVESVCSFSLDVPMLGGSYPWMAPELLNDYVPSIVGDVWVFGMSILELFTRLVPFHDCKQASCSESFNTAFLIAPRRHPPTFACRMHGGTYARCAGRKIQRHGLLC
ncbi:hypothetical protein ID866_9348 [Astraeus odoratus]|nr:hypothetical protein ID866_9348 [Astraeus odoratus]